MAMFVHLAPESLMERIRRGGIRRLRRPYGAFPGGVFAVPMTPSFYLSHQWLRELKRRNAGPIVGVYFRIADKERVWIGHYSGPHRSATAAEAVAAFLANEYCEGWEVVIPRRIGGFEIHRIRRIPQVIGWRYKPDSHGIKPCGCDYCQRGQYGGRRLRQSFRSNRS